MSDVATIKAALDCGKAGCACRRNGKTHCPAHDDQDPSLSITAGKHVPVIVKCHANCAPETVIGKLREMELWPAREANAPIPIRKPRGLMQLVKEWPWPNDGSPPIAIHGRFEDGAGNKDVRWRLPEGEYADGLKGMKLSQLPLYNAHLLEQRPDDVVYFVEGEPAADAGEAAGLLTVSLPGGAAQTDFGTALEALNGRQVALWPDNDPQGQQLMRRLKSALPDAAFVANPSDMPEKGDAANFFAMGHTVDEIRLNTNAPCIEVRDRFVSVVLPHEGGTVGFEFAHINYQHGTMDAEVSVLPQLVGKTSDTFTAHLSVNSISGRDAFRRTLEKQYEFAKDFNWTALLNRACQLARGAFLDAPAAIDIEDVVISVGDDYRVDRFAPMVGVTTIFGMGDSLKGHAMISLSLAINAGAPWLGRPTIATNVLYLDYEDGQQTMARRRNRHIIGLPEGIYVPPGAFHYMPGGGIGVADNIESIGRELKRTRSGVLYIDSAIQACGGDPNKPDVAGRMFSVLNALSVTVFLIAHTDKLEHERMPFGSVVWHNGSRMTWFVSRTPGDDESAEARIGFYCRKANNDMRPRPFGLRVAFDDAGQRMGPITIASYDLRDDADQSKRLPLAVQVEHALRGGPLPYGEIGSAIGAQENSVRKAVQRAPKRFVVTGEGGKLFVSNRETRFESA